MSKVTRFAKSAGIKISLATLGAATMASTAFADQFGTTTINPLNFWSGSLNSLVGQIINVVLLITGVLAVFYLIWGGISYVTAGGDAEKASKGRVAITNAIIGIIIIIAALAIYNYVAQNLGS